MISNQSKTDIISDVYSGNFPIAHSNKVNPKLHKSLSYEYV